MKGRSGMVLRGKDSAILMLLLKREFYMGNMGGRSNQNSSLN